MQDKPARLTVLIDAERKRAFEELCAAQDITASQVVRQLIRDYLELHGMSPREERTGTDD
ncbi:MAG: ribbon-helix-helix protein, CopG family [Ramlibacter sp.]